MSDCLRCVGGSGRFKAESCGHFPFCDACKSFLSSSSLTECPECPPGSSSIQSFVLCAPVLASPPPSVSVYVHNAGISELNGEYQSTAASPELFRRSPDCELVRDVVSQKCWLLRRQDGDSVLYKSRSNQSDPTACVYDCVTGASPAPVVSDSPVPPALVTEPEPERDRSQLPVACVEELQSLKKTAIDHYKAGDFVQSAALLSRCIDASLVFKLDCNSRAALYSNRSLAHFALKRFASAAEDAEKALVLDPENPKAQYRLAHALFVLEDLDKAAYFAEKVFSKTSDAGAKNLLLQISAARNIENQGAAPQSFYTPKKHEVQPASVQACAPDSNCKIRNFTDLELRLRKVRDSDDALLSEEITPEIFMYFANKHPVLFSDSELLGKFLVLLDRLSEGELLDKYGQVLLQVKLSMAVAMLTKAERKIFERVIQRIQ